MAKSTTLGIPDLAGSSDEPELVTAKPMIILTREQIRAAMFADVNSQPKSVLYEFLGQKLEWRCPSILEMQEQRDQEGRNLMVSLIVGYSFIPGTEEKVFVDGDYDTIIQMPMSGSFQEAVTKISETINLKVEEKVKN